VDVTLCFVILDCISGRDQKYVHRRMCTESEVYSGTYDKGHFQRVLHCVTESLFEVNAKAFLTSSAEIQQAPTAKF